MGKGSLVMVINGKYLGKYEGFPVYACDQLWSPLSIAKRKGKGYVLLRGKTCKRFSDEEIRTIYFHEIGHIILGHVETDVALCLEQEIAADLYAANLVGHQAVIKVLEKTASMYSTFREILLTKQRILALRNCG